MDHTMSNKDYTTVLHNAKVFTPCHSYTYPNLQMVNQPKASSGKSTYLGCRHQLGKDKEGEWKSVHKPY